MELIDLYFDLDGEFEENDIETNFYNLTKEIFKNNNEETENGKN